MWPFEVLGGIFEEFLNLREIKPFEVQGEYGGESLILVYASTLPTDTFPIKNFLVLLGFDYFKTRPILVS